MMGETRAAAALKSDQQEKGNGAMRVIHTLVAFALLSCSGIRSQANAADVCKGYGPQTPRDISSKRGSNVRAFVIAPSPENMNLCNIHFHTQAEHKGPGYSISAGAWRIPV